MGIKTKHWRFVPGIAYASRTFCLSNDLTNAHYRRLAHVHQLTMMDAVGTVEHRGIARKRSIVQRFEAFSGVYARPKISNTGEIPQIIRKSSGFFKH